MTLIIDRKFNLFSSLFLKSCRKCMMFYMISIAMWSLECGTLVIARRLLQSLDPRLRSVISQTIRIKPQFIPIASLPDHCCRY